MSKAEADLRSELIGEFQKEREGHVEVKKVDRNPFIDPKPIVIKDGSGKKIASYELDMVRWSRRVGLYSTCGVVMLINL